MVIVVVTGRRRESSLLLTTKPLLITVVWDPRRLILSSSWHPLLACKLSRPFHCPKHPLSALPSYPLFNSHLAFNFPLSKLYTNSLLSSLNARGGWAYSSSSQPERSVNMLSSQVVSIFLFALSPSCPFHTV